MHIFVDKCTGVIKKLKNARMVDGPFHNMLKQKRILGKITSSEVISSPAIVRI